MDSSLLIGVCVSLLAASCGSLGVNLQASALNKQRILHAKQETSILSEDAQSLTSPDTESESQSIPSTSIESLPFARFDEAAMLSIQWYIGFFLYLLTQITGSGIFYLFKS
jgi:hypothetical protein